MRALGFVVLCAVLLPGCRERRETHEERLALYEASVRIGDLIADSQYVAADSTAEAWLSGEYQEAIRLLDPVSDRLYEGRDLLYADTVAAYVLARQAHARRLAGDTAGTVATYGRLLPYRDLLPDSTAARVLRWMAWNAAKMDPVEGLRLMDVAEHWARERGLIPETLEILRCKSELISRMSADDIAPQVEGVEPRGDRPWGRLILLALLVYLSYDLGRYVTLGTIRPHTAPRRGRAWSG